MTHHPKARVRSPFSEHLRGVPGRHALNQEDLHPDDTRRTLDNTFIHATVIRYSEEHDGDEAIYRLFERLNSGGTRLHPHEIRVALLNGRLVNLVRDLNRNEDWRALFGSVSQRLKDQELILRFISLRYAADEYKRPLSSFLRKFLSEHRNIEGLNEAEIRSLFANVCRAVNAGIGKPAFRVTRNINAALVDAVMIGVARRLDKGSISDQAALRPAFDSLLEDEGFLAAIGRATADEARVRDRLTKATSAFESV